MNSLTPLAGLALIALALPAAGGSVNLENPFFDDADQLEGWAVLNNRIAEWDALDADGLSGSGSARLTSDVDGNNGALAILAQCLPVQPGNAYLFGASVNKPAGQPEGTGNGRVVTRVFPEDDCTGDSHTTFTSAVEGTGKWLLTEGAFPTGSADRSARLTLSIQKYSGVDDDITVHFDNVFVVSDRVFGDGFEAE